MGLWKFVKDVWYGFWGKSPEKSAEDNEDINAREYENRLQEIENKHKADAELQAKRLVESEKQIAAERQEKAKLKAESEARFKALEAEKEAQIRKNVEADVQKRIREEFQSQFEALQAEIKQREAEAERKLKALEAEKEAQVKANVEAELQKRKELEEKEKLEALKKASEEVQRKRAERRKELGIDNVSKYNIAVSGHSGVGKSSLLNGLLGLSGKEAAKIGRVECTMKITPYFNPKSPKLILWDLPGGNTTTHPAETYYEDKVLHAFDAIVIVTGNRLLDIEIQIAKKSRKAGKAVVFVRTKADLDVKQVVDDMFEIDGKEISMVEAADVFRAEVEADFKRHMQKVELSDVDILIVSNRAFTPSRVPPYKKDDDTSLEGMDEEVLRRFLLQSAATRFNDVNVIRNMFEAKKANIGNTSEAEEANIGNMFEAKEAK